MVLFKAIQEIILPSVFIFILFFFGFLFLNKKKQKQGKIILLIGLGIYYIFSITPTSDFLLSFLENQYKTTTVQDIKGVSKIVLLLGGREADIARASEVLRIYNLAKEHGLNIHIIISGTDPIGVDKTEADSVRKFLVERGVKEEDVSLEIKSKTTRESAENLSSFLGDQTFLLVTSGYHMPRSIEIFKKNRTNPQAAPADFKQKKHYSFFDFFPSANNIREADLSFHEYFGILFYRLF